MTIYTLISHEYDNSELLYAGTDLDKLREVVSEYDEGSLWLHVTETEDGVTNVVDIRDVIHDYDDIRTKQQLRAHAERYINTLAESVDIAKRCFANDETAERLYMRTRGCATYWTGGDMRPGLPDVYQHAAKLLKEAGDYAKQQQGIIDTVTP